MIQKVKDKTWLDEQGKEVPVEYITPGTRLKERHAGTLLTEAKLLNGRIADYKAKMQRLCHEVYVKAMEEFKAKADTRGNFTFFNFDRSIKIEVSISDRISFDDIAIQAAKEKLMTFLDENLTSKMEFIKDLVIDAFSTSKGKIDAKKVLQLTKYRSRISHPLFQEALNILEAGIVRPESRTYFRIWERNESGVYNLIDLNFSSVNAPDPQNNRV